MKRLQIYFIASFSCFLASPALSHVKWFAPYNVAQMPLPLGWMTTLDFGILVVTSAMALSAGVAIETSPIGRYLTEGLNRLTKPIQDQALTLIRACFGGFFVVLWALGSFILTPELKTTSVMVGLTQIVIGASMIWTPTLIVAAAGIVALYGFATAEYGVFHMMDYPIFLGSAAYFALSALGWQTTRTRPIDVLRVAAGITLMWASVEKWAYPDWTVPLLAEHPDMTMGLDTSFFMKAAGMVEFALGSALLGPSLVRRISAIALAVIFTAAIAGFGKIDAIGHAPIIITLIIVAADSNPGRRWSADVVPILFLMGLAATIGAYYGLHGLLF